MALVSRITQIDRINPDPAINEIVNGGLETGDFTGWGSHVNCTISSTEHHTGLYSASFGWSAYLYYNIAPSIAKEELDTFSVWVKAPTTATLHVNLFYDVGWVEGTDFAVTADWTQIDLKSVMHAGYKVNQVEFFTLYGSQTIFLDDLTLYSDRTAAQTVIDKILSMPAVTGTVEVTGSEDEPLLQRASTFDLIVQLRSAGVEIDPRAIRALTAADIVTVLCANLDVALSTRALEAGGNLAAILAQLDSKTSTLFKATQNIGNTTFGATQATRTSLKVQPEREDIVSLGGVASPSAAGVQIVAGSGSLVPKVYDAEYEGLADGLHYFYFGTDTSPTTKRFLSRNTKGVNSKTFVQPRVGAAGDGIYLYSSVAETNMPYDLGYVLE
jgi:hypothetical protein